MYELSKRVRLELKPSLYASSDQYVKLVKSNDRTRWMNLSMAVWRTIIDLYPTVNEDAMYFPERDHEKTYRLSTDTMLKLSRFKGVLYLGFGQWRGRYLNIINLNMAEWDNMKAAFDALHVSHNEPETPQKNVVLRQYQWRLLKESGETIQTGDWTFLSDRCTNEGEAYEALHGLQGQNVKLAIEERERILPLPLDLLKMTYAFLAQKEIQIITKEKCFGCVENRDSQTDHMGINGCLDMETDLVHLYTTEACARVPTEHAVELIRSLCEKFELPLSPVFQEPLAKNLPTITGNDVYAYYTLNDKDFDELFEFLSK